jgi:hypothetical protein
VSVTVNVLPGLKCLNNETNPLTYCATVLITTVKSFTGKALWPPDPVRRGTPCRCLSIIMAVFLWGRLWGQSTFKIVIWYGSSYANRAPHNWNVFQALANLFCVQLQRLQLTYVDTGHGTKNKKKSVRSVKPWTNFSRQDETWAEFSALETCVPRTCCAVKQCG